MKKNSLIGHILWVFLSWAFFSIVFFFTTSKTLVYTIIFSYPVVFVVYIFRFYVFKKDQKHDNQSNPG